MGEGTSSPGTRPGNLDVINRMFELQAEGFEDEGLAFTREGWLSHLVEVVAPAGSDSVLEVCAGTCACGRALALGAGVVVCLDATEGMLRVGAREARAAGLANMAFVHGYAQDLPFLDGSFDVVLSRLAFHHLEDPRAAFDEMCRVLRPGGRLVLVDMEAAPEALRATQDRIETLRDPSHVRNLSLDEMRALFHGAGLSVARCEVARVRQHLGRWLDLTRTPDGARREVEALMAAELAGGAPTGFAPYVHEGEVCFDQRWVLTLATS